MKVTGSFIGIVMVSEKKHITAKRGAASFAHWGPHSQHWTSRRPRRLAWAMPGAQLRLVLAAGCPRSWCWVQICLCLCSAAGCVGSADGWPLAECETHVVSNCGTALVVASKRRSLFSTQESWARPHRHQFALLCDCWRASLPSNCLTTSNVVWDGGCFCRSRARILRISMILEACLRALSCVFRSFIMTRWNVLVISKWSFNPYKWPYTWVSGVVTSINGVITLLNW